LGLLTPEAGGWAAAVDLSDWAARLASLRTAAMATKNFAAVDALKAALVAAGVDVRMSKTGVDVVAGAGFDAAKLRDLR
jgi:cysteinyl-tRNA synthetase